MGEAEMPSAGQGAPARWTRLAVLGLIMVALGPLLFVVATLIWGLDFGNASFFLIILAIPLVGAVLVWRFGSWAKIVGIVTALVPAGMTFWTAFGLAMPGSFFEFVPGLLVMPGAIIAIVSCVGGLVAGRRGHLSATTTGGERVALRLIPGLLLLAAIVSAVLTFTGRSSASAGAAEETLTLKDFQFDPRELDIDGSTRVLLRNDDPFFHTFTIDELDIDESFTPGDEIIVEIPAKAGTYVFYCRPHTSDPEKPTADDMAGSLNVG